MRRLVRQLYFPLRVSRRAVVSASVGSVEARRLAVALRETSQGLIDLTDGTERPPDVIYEMKPRECYVARTKKENEHAN